MSRGIVDADGRGDFMIVPPERAPNPPAESPGCVACSPNAFGWIILAACPIHGIDAQPEYWGRPSAPPAGTPRELGRLGDSTSGAARLRAAITPLPLTETPLAAVDAAEECLREFGYDVSGECSVYVANAVLRAAGPPAATPGQRDEARILLEVGDEDFVTLPVALFRAMRDAFLRAAPPREPGEAKLKEIADDVLQDWYFEHQRAERLEREMEALRAAPPAGGQPSDQLEDFRSLCDVLTATLGYSVIWRAPRKEYHDNEWGGWFVEKDVGEGRRTATPLTAALRAVPSGPRTEEPTDG